MKLKDLEASETGRLQLKSISGEPLYAEGVDGKNDPSKPIVVVLYGPGTREGEKARSLYTSRVMRGIGVPGADDKDKEDFARRASMLAACTVRIENLDVEQTAAGFKAFYENPRLGYLVEQIEAFQAGWANFLPASTSS